MEYFDHKRSISRANDLGICCCCPVPTWPVLLVQAIRSDNRFNRLLDELNTKASLLSPEHLSDVGKSLNTLGTALEFNQ